MRPNHRALWSKGLVRWHGYVSTRKYLIPYEEVGEDDNWIIDPITYLYMLQSEDGHWYHHEYGRNLEGSQAAYNEYPE